MTTNQDGEKKTKENPSLMPIDWILLIVIMAVLLSLSVILINDLISSNAGYSKVLNGSLTQENTLAYLRAKDFMNIKIIVLIVSFLLIFTGALYLVKIFNISYHVSADNAAIGKLSIQSTSPGLVMITLGVFLIIAVLCTHTEVNIDGAVPETAVSGLRTDSLASLNKNFVSQYSSKSPLLNIPPGKQGDGTAERKERERQTRQRNTILQMIKQLNNQTPHNRVMTHDT